MRTDARQHRTGTGGTGNRGRRFARLAVTASVSVATTLSLSCSAHAATIAPDSQYVALGSSIAAGPILPPLVDVGCLRSGSNYPSLVAKALSLRLVDVTCSSATTANVLSTPQALTGGGSNPVQITAVGPATRLVTASIGGNDLQYVGRLTADSCGNTPVAVLPGICGALAARPAAAPTVADYVAVENRLVQIVDAVRGRAPFARMVLVDYLPILDPNDRTCALTPLTDAQWQTNLRVADGLSSAMQRAADRTGATLVHASALGVGHTPCSPDPWMSGFQPPPPTGGPTPYHATLAGMAAVADAVVRAVG